MTVMVSVVFKICVKGVWGGKEIRLALVRERNRPCQELRMFRGDGLKSGQRSTKWAILLSCEILRSPKVGKFLDMKRKVGLSDVSLGFLCVN